VKVELEAEAPKGKKARKKAKKAAK
jgi:hypothetical protein